MAETTDRLGETVREPIGAIPRWGDEHLAEIVQAWALFDDRADS